MDIRLLTDHDTEEFVRLRIEALTCEPYAFARALEGGPTPWPPENVAVRLRAVPAGNFLIGAFAGRQMVGQAGVIRYDGRKVHHKGQILGGVRDGSRPGTRGRNSHADPTVGPRAQYSDLKQVTLSGRVRSHHLMLQTWIDMLSRVRHTCALGPSMA